MYANTGIQSRRAGGYKIKKDDYLCKHRYTRSYPTAERRQVDQVYERNGEGCYVLEVIAGGKRICLDATIAISSFGRYINHVARKKANVKLHPPLWVRGKWRVAFLATKDINIGEELGYDYGQEKDMPDWMRRRNVSWRAYTHVTVLNWYRYANHPLP